MALSTQLRWGGCEEGGTQGGGATLSKHAWMCVSKMEGNGSFFSIK